MPPPPKVVRNEFSCEGSLDCFDSLLRCSLAGDFFFDLNSTRKRLPPNASLLIIRGFIARTMGDTLSLYTRREACVTSIGFVERLEAFAFAVELGFTLASAVGIV